MKERHERESIRQPDDSTMVSVRDADGEVVACAIYTPDAVEALVGALLVAQGDAPVDGPLEPGWSSPWPLTDAATLDRARARACDLTRQARSRRSHRRV
jgi:hypothetical protein